jgi:hypothetical protein
MSVYEGSRHEDADAISYNGVDILEARIVKKYKNYDTIIFSQGDRLDLIARDYYGDSKMKWIILDANGYAHDLQVSVGDILKIPVLEEVDTSV